MTSVPFKGREIDVNEHDVAAVETAFGMIRGDLTTLVNFIEEEERGARAQDRELPALLTSSSLRSVLDAERKELRHVEQLMVELDSALLKLRGEADQIMALIPRLDPAVWSAVDAKSAQNPVLEERKRLSAYLAKTRTLLNENDALVRAFISDFAKAEKLFVILRTLWYQYSGHIEDIVKQVGYAETKDLFKQFVDHHVDHMRALNAIGEQLFRDFGSLMEKNLLRKQNIMLKRLKERLLKPPEEQWG